MTMPDPTPQEDKDMGDPGGVTTVSSSELRSELRRTPDIDFVHKAEAMHRRAQKAESELHRALKQVGHMNRMLRSADNRERKWRRRCRSARARLEALANGPQGQDAADPPPRDEQQPLQETDHDR